MLRTLFIVNMFFLDLNYIMYALESQEIKIVPIKLVRLTLFN